MRNQHLPVLDNAEDCTKFFEISQAFAQAKLPEEIVSALRMGQMTAQQKSEELLLAMSSGGWWQKLLRSSS